jgi:hypothetical protein
VERPLYETPRKISGFFGVLTDTPVSFSPFLDDAERKFFLFPFLFVFPIRLLLSEPNHKVSSEDSLYH